jgi:hypothetical protein
MSSSTITFDAPEHSISAPTTIIWHLISDEELTMLITQGKDKSLEWGLALGGAAFGALPTLTRVLSEIMESKPVGGFDLFWSVIAIAVFSAAVVLVISHFRNEKNIASLEDRIRNRQGSGLKVVSSNTTAAA